MSPHKHTVILAESAARTATESWTMNTPCLGGFFIVHVTASAATPSVVFTINGVGPSGATWTILTSAAVTGASTNVYRIHPELTAAANTIAKDMLPSTIKVTATHSNADSITYSVTFIGTN